MLPMQEEKHDLKLFPKIGKWPFNGSEHRPPKGNGTANYSVHASDPDRTKVLAFELSFFSVFASLLVLTLWAAHNLFPQSFMQFTMRHNLFELSLPYLYRGRAPRHRPHCDGLPPVPLQAVRLCGH